MKKYKNVRVFKARRCTSYRETYGTMNNVCIGIKEPCKTTCGGYCCKCTEYDYKSKLK